ncbi:MAG: hypothetical protein EOO88_24285, partial [Pedobacter sp.]
MGKKAVKKRIAILGGGPSGLFMYKRLVESDLKNIEIEIFERKSYLGAGMPYSKEGANEEHITNVSDNEIPVIFNTIEEWVKQAPTAVLKKFNINSENFNEYKVLPRLFFGEYLSAQFGLLQEAAERKGIVTVVHLHTQVKDLHYNANSGAVSVTVDQLGELIFDYVVICIGHNWPKKYEGTIPGYFDSPYPPQKLAIKLNHAVGIKGASLTAIDALRTMSRHNGTFEEIDGKICYSLNDDSEGFKLVMHSRSGLLPAIRFHLEDSHLGKDALIGKEEIEKNIADNGGFLSLDFVFEKNFKDMFPEKDPEFYYLIKDMDIEMFVEAMMEMREKIPPFELFRKEYVEAEQSIKERESIYWKEMLAVLSFAMNYPAKYLSAEDMQRLQKVLMPLISIVIAFVPQSSCRELMALHDAGVLDLVSVGDDSRIVPVDSGGAEYHYTSDEGESIVQHFETFVDCVGQPHLSFKDFPFKGLLEGNAVSPARLRFQSAAIAKEEVDSGNELVEEDDEGSFFLKVPGITINDNFQVVDSNGAANEKIYIMAVPY